jgi:hypothetical protein
MRPEIGETTSTSGAMVAMKPSTSPASVAVR